MSEDSMESPGSQPVERSADRGETMTFGKLHLSTFPTEHDASAWEQNKDHIRASVAQSPIIIPEYFPPEFSVPNNVIGKQILETSKDTDNLFYQLADLSQEMQKDVWVLDPAYTMDFGYVRDLLQIPQVTIEEAVLLALGSKALNATTSRRSFLRGAGKVALGTAAAVMASPLALGSMSPALDYETAFRMSVVAEHLKGLSTNVPENSKALLIYPPEHLKKIVNYLRNDQERQAVIQKFLPLKSVDKFKPLFQARHYKAQDRSWQRIEAREI